MVGTAMVILLKKLAALIMVTMEIFIYMLNGRRLLTQSHMN